MKKKILSMALIAISMVAFTGKAQNATTVTPCDNSANCPAQVCDTKQCPEMSNLFHGINLTDAQKGQLKQLKEKNQAERKAKLEARKAEKQDKAAKVAADRKARMDKRREVKKAYLVEIKNILTPEQYVQFLENNYVNASPRHDKGFGKKDARHGNKQAFNKNRKDRKHADKMAFGKKQGQRKGDRAPRQASPAPKA